MSPERETTRLGHLGTGHAAHFCTLYRLAPRILSSGACLLSLERVRVRPFVTAAPPRVLWTLVLPLLLGACQHGVARTGSAPAPSRDSVDVGYGTALRRDVTGSISTLDGDVTRQSSPLDVADMIEGRFAGVEVRRLPGGGVSIRIRGSRSFMGDNEPLYVVDGIPQRLSNNENLRDLDPHDIKSIEVLKDATATAVYGARGANGVILITTRHFE